jgi:hypothetical protein
MEKARVLMITGFLQGHERLVSGYQQHSTKQSRARDKHYGVLVIIKLEGLGVPSIISIAQSRAGPRTSST